jgi:hypothetical protein
VLLPRCGEAGPLRHRQVRRAVGTRRPLDRDRVLVEGTAVAEVAGVEPALFVAVTVIRSVVPASTCFSA